MHAQTHGIKHWIEPAARLGAGLTIRGIGLQERMAPCRINRPVGTGDWLCMAFSTPIELGDAGGVRLHTEPCVILWPPRVRQQYGHPDAPFVHSWMHCDGTFVASAARGARLPLNTAIPVADWNRMETPLRLLLDELRRPEPPDTPVARGYCGIFLRTLACGLRTVAPAMPDAIWTVRDFMEENAAEPLTLAELARLAFCSEAHLCETFRRWFGMPPIDYLITLRMHKATYLLHDTNLRIGDIARLVGYDDVYYFSRLFRKRTGVSPRAMRARLLGNAPS